MDRESRPWLPRNAAHLAALWAFAVLQPTLSVMSQNADVFIVRRVDGWTCVAATAIVTVVPPAVLVGLEALAGAIGPRLREWLHLVFVWGLLALFALYMLKETFPTMGVASIPIAWALAAAGALAYARLPAVGSLLTFLSPAPLVFAAYFLLLSPAHKLIFPPDAPGSARAQTSTPVVMLVLDELPLSSLVDDSGHVDAKLFPNFARLADGAIWYRRTVAAADQTEQAVPAIMTGTRPSHGKLAVLRDHPDNVFTLLARSHRPRVMEHITWLCPRSVCPDETPPVRRVGDFISAMSYIYAHAVAPAGIGGTVGVLGATWHEAKGGTDPRERVDPDAASAPTLSHHRDAEFQRFLNGIRPYEPSQVRPPFHFLHSGLPHPPWLFTPSGNAYVGRFETEPGLEEGGNRWGSNRDLVQHGLRRHLLQVRYCDLLLGRLLRRLEQTGMYDRSLLVVTADHGASFVPSANRRPVDRTAVADVGLVPFFVKSPRQTRGKVVDAYLQTTDVLPNVADELGVAVPWHLDGRPASELGGRGRSRVRVERHTGGAVTVSSSLVDRQFRETVQRMVAEFGSGRGLAGLYGRGPDRDLVGREVGDLDGSGGSGWAVLDRAAEFRQVDTASRFIPALVSGQVDPGVGRVAIGINGRVGAVAPTHEEAGGRRFMVTIPEGSLNDGANEVAVYSVRGNDRDRRLVELSNRG